MMRWIMDSLPHAWIINSRYSPFVSDLLEVAWPRCSPAGAIVLKGMVGDRAGEPRSEIFMTDSNAWHNPSEDHPPSRPGRLVFLGAAVLCAVAIAISNWAAISSFAHVPQIKTALGF
jgi:hypothetical protein